MTNKEAIDLLEYARATIEWEYPIDYSVAIDKAIEVLKEKVRQEENWNTKVASKESFEEFNSSLFNTIKESIQKSEDLNSYQVTVLADFEESVTASGEDKNECE